MDEDSSQDGTCKLTFDEVRCDRTDNIEMIIKEDTISVKDEPMSDQEYIETSSCPPSPCSTADDTPRHYGKVIPTFGVWKFFNFFNFFFFSINLCDKSKKQ